MRKRPSSARQASHISTLKPTGDYTSIRSIAATSHPTTAKMSLVSGEKSNFQFILRLLNTNVRCPRVPLLRGTGLQEMAVLRANRILDIC